MKRFLTNKYFLFGLGVIFVFALWFLIYLLSGQSNAIFPSPIDTFICAFSLLSDSYTYVCLGYTFLRMVVGFLISFVLSFVLGLLSGNSEKVKQFLEPLMITLKAIPTAVIVFLFLVIVAPKNAPICVVVLISLPILYEAIVGGLKSTPSAISDASKVDGANPIVYNFKIKIPLAISYIIVGVTSSFSLSLKIEIMAEIITGYTKNGLGNVINYTRNQDPSNMVPIFAYALIAIVVMLLISLATKIINNLVNLSKPIMLNKK